ncbi:hypothetical protein D3C75_1019530 [compost metagenome]
MLLGIVTHPVIQLVMLVAAHLRAYSTGGGTRSCTANPATDMWVAGRRCAVCGIGGYGIAIIDIQLHLLAALALERHHRLRLGCRCRAQQHQQATPRHRTHGKPPAGGDPVSQNSSPLLPMMAVLPGWSKPDIKRGSPAYHGVNPGYLWKPHEPDPAPDHL